MTPIFACSLITWLAWVPLSDPSVGLVTCMFRPEGDTSGRPLRGFGGCNRLSSVHDRRASAGCDRFRLGSRPWRFAERTWIALEASRRSRDYLADDYQLGHRIHGLGLKCVLSDAIVTTHLGGTGRDVWTHQVRWARTVRVSKFWGYVGTSAGLCDRVGRVGRRERIFGLALALLAVRMADGDRGRLVRAAKPGCVADVGADSRSATCYGAAVWVAGLFGRTVTGEGICWRSTGMAESAPDAGGNRLRRTERRTKRGDG